jgi:hypothetical protein
MCLVTLHSRNIFRIWDVYDGCLIAERKLTGGPAAVWPLGRGSGLLLVQLGDRDLKVLDSISWKECGAVMGFSKTKALVCVDVFEQRVSAIDCNGQVWTCSIEGLERGDVPACKVGSGHAEAFSVSVHSDLLAVVCPLKITVYRLRGEAVDGIRSVLVESVGDQWAGAVVMSSGCVIGWTKAGSFFELLTETRVSIEISILPVLSCSRIDGNTLFVRGVSGNLSVLTVIYYEEKFVGFYYPVKFPRGAGNSSSMHVVAGDDAHNLFLVSLEEQALIIRPMSVSDCSFELEPMNVDEAGSITCLAAWEGRVFAGSGLGHIASYRVGTSKIEKSVNIHSNCAILKIQGIAKEKSTFCSLDARGVITIISNNSVACRLQPNWLIPLLMTGYVFDIDIAANTVSCLVTHPFDRSKEAYTETWSLSNPNRYLHSSCPKKEQPPQEEDSCPSHQRPSFLSHLFNLASPTAEEKKNLPEISRSDPFSVENKCGHQVVSFDIAQKLHPHKQLINQLLEGSSHTISTFIGTSARSRLTGTLQVGFRVGKRPSGPSRLDTLIRLTSRHIGSCSEGSTNTVDYHLNLWFLISLVSKKNPSSFEEARFQSCVIAMIQTEIGRRFDDFKQKIVDLQVLDPTFSWLLLLMLSVAPHAVPGYSICVRELAGMESVPDNISDDSKSWLSIIQYLLREVHANSWLYIKIFAFCYSHVRQLVFEKSLFHDIFVLLCGNVRPSMNPSRLDDERETASPSITPAPLPAVEKCLSDVSVDCLIAIGLRNPSKFCKRLALVTKSSHSAFLALHLVKLFIERATRHSLTFLPIFFEIVVLPCLDPMDYRLRKSAVGPVTHLFKSLNRHYPMTAFHQGKQKFAVGTTQGQVNIYDIRTGTKWRILDGHTGAISSIGYDPSGKYLCSYSATDCTIRVWQITSGGVAGAGAVVVKSNTVESILGGFLSTSGGKCVVVKQLGPIDEDASCSGIRHPFNIAFKISSVKIRWTSANDILLVRENGRGLQLRI